MIPMVHPICCAYMSVYPSSLRSVDSSSAHRFVLQCMVAFFIPTNRGGEGIKWGLVSYTAAIFFVSTVHTAIGLNRWCASRAARTPIGPSPYGARRYPKSYVLLEQPTSRRFSGQFFVQCCISPPEVLMPAPLPSHCNLRHKPPNYRVPLSHVPLLQVGI